MKKLLFLFVMIFLFSCEKEEETHCYKCDTQAKNFTSSLTTCEMTDSEIRKFEIALRIQAMSITDSVAVVICDRTECLEESHN
jgi:hypothetical protein